MVPFHPVKISVAIRTDHIALRDFRKDTFLAPPSVDAVSNIDRLVTCSMVKVETWNPVFAAGTSKLPLQMVEPLAQLTFAGACPLLDTLLVSGIMATATLSTLFPVRITPRF